MKPTVMVVDDTETNIDILVDILDDEYEVSVAMDGESALQGVAEDPPDLILLDIMMPGMDGYEVCRRLKENDKTRDIPVIFVTAMNDVEDETRGFDTGGVDYITKPVSPPIVLARVKNHLALEAARRTLKEQNQELIEAAKLREDVEKITRHDLKSPLNMIIGAPQAIKTFGDVNEKQQKYLGYIEETGYRMLDMINRSLDIFKMERGLYKCRFEQVEIVDIIEKVIAETRNLCSMNDVNISVLVNGIPPDEEASFIIQGEELLFFSMIENLTKNAVEASPEGGEVGIYLDKNGSPGIRIQNRGSVPEVIRDKFFDKFVTAEKEDGTGLGTYSAKLIAETMNGIISMESSEEEGTCITIVFPEKESSLNS